MRASLSKLQGRILNRRKVKALFELSGIHFPQMMSLQQSHISVFLTQFDGHIRSNTAAVDRLTERNR